MSLIHAVVGVKWKGPLLSAYDDAVAHLGSDAAPKDIFNRMKEAEPYSDRIQQMVARPTDALTERGVAQHHRNSAQRSTAVRARIEDESREGAVVFVSRDGQEIAFTPEEASLCLIVQNMDDMDTRRIQTPSIDGVTLRRVRAYCTLKLTEPKRLANIAGQRAWYEKTLKVAEEAYAAALAARKATEDKFIAAGLNKPSREQRKDAYLLLRKAHSRLSEHKRSFGVNYDTSFELNDFFCKMTLVELLRIFDASMYMDVVVLSDDACRAVIAVATGAVTADAMVAESTVSYDLCTENLEEQLLIDVKLVDMKRVHPAFRLDHESVVKGIMKCAGLEVVSEFASTQLTRIAIYTKDFEMRRFRSLTEKAKWKAVAFMGDNQTIAVLNVDPKTLCTSLDYMFRGYPFDMVGTRLTIQFMGKAVAGPGALVYVLSRQMPARSYGGLSYHHIQAIDVVNRCLVASEDVGRGGARRDHVRPCAFNLACGYIIVMDRTIFGHGIVITLYDTKKLSHISTSHIKTMKSPILDYGYFAEIHEISSSAFAATFCDRPRYYAYGEDEHTEEGIHDLSHRWYEDPSSAIFVFSIAEEKCTLNKEVRCAGKNKQPVMMNAIAFSHGLVTLECAYGAAGTFSSIQVRVWDARNDLLSEPNVARGVPDSAIDELYADTDRNKTNICLSHVSGERGNRVWDVISNDYGPVVSSQPYSLEAAAKIKTAVSTLATKNMSAADAISLIGESYASWPVFGESEDGYISPATLLTSSSARPMTETGPTMRIDAVDRVNEKWLLRDMETPVTVAIEEITVYDGQRSCKSIISIPVDESSAANGRRYDAPQPDRIGQITWMPLG